MSSHPQPHESTPLPQWPAGDPVTPANRGHDPAWQRAWQRQRRALERFPRQTRPIVMLGDSTVSCWRYAGRGRVPWARHFLGIGVNFGVTGDETQHLRWRLRESNWSGLDPVVVVVSCGANHRYREGAVSGYAAGLRALVHDIAQRWPGATRFLLSLPWAETPGGVVSPLHADFAAITRRVAGEFVHGCTSVPMLLPDWVLPDGTLDVRLVNDGVHPTRSGYAHLAGSLRAAFAEAGVALPPVRAAWTARMSEPVARLVERMAQ